MAENQETTMDGSQTGSADLSSEEYYPSGSSEQESISTEKSSYEVSVIQGEEIDFEQLQQELENDDEAVTVRLRKTLQNSGDNLGSCCFMRTTGWYYSNGRIAADTYMNHYCMIGKFTARSIIKIFGINPDTGQEELMLELHSGEYTTAGERQWPWGGQVGLDQVEDFNKNATRMEIVHQVTYNGW